MKVPDLGKEIDREESIFDYVFRYTQGDISDEKTMEILRDDADYWRRAAKEACFRTDEYFK